MARGKKKKNLQSAKKQLAALIKSRSARQKQSIILNANPKVISALKKIAGSVLRGKMPMTSVQFRLLKKHKGNLRKLARLKGSIAAQRKAITRQNGGFLPLLAPLLAPLLGPVVSAIAPVAQGILGAFTGGQRRRR